MFEKMMKKLNEGIIEISIYQNIVLKQKNDFYFLKYQNKNKFPIDFIEYNNKEYNINYLNISLEDAKLIQVYVAENFNQLIFEETEKKLKKLSFYLNNNLIISSQNLINESLTLLKNEWDNKTFKEIILLLQKIDKEQEQFYEFFNIIASDSSTPLANYLENIEFLLKLKIDENILNSSSFFEILYEYYEFKENNINETYILQFWQDDKEYNIKINNIEELITEYLKLC